MLSFSGLGGEDFLERTRNGDIGRERYTNVGSEFKAHAPAPAPAPAAWMSLVASFGCHIGNVLSSRPMKVTTRILQRR